MKNGLFSLLLIQFTAWSEGRERRMGNILLFGEGSDSMMSSIQRSTVKLKKHNSNGMSLIH